MPATSHFIISIQLLKRIGENILNRSTATFASAIYSVVCDTTVESVLQEIMMSARNVLHQASIVST